MKHFVRTAALAALATVGMSTMALATCMTGCTGGDTPPPPEPTTLTVSIGGSVGTAGYGASDFTGIGESYAVKEGGSTLVVGLTGNGGLCPDEPCDAFGAYGIGALYENVQVGALGATEHADTLASGFEETATAGQIVMNWPTGSYQLNIDAGSAGAATAMFGGDQGLAYGMTEGYNNIAAGMNIDGLCPTCYSGGWNVAAEVGETAMAGAAGYSATPGVPSTAFNTTATAAQIGVELNFAQ